MDEAWRPIRCSLSLLPNPECHSAWRAIEKSLLEPNSVVVIELETLWETEVISAKHLCIVATGDICRNYLCRTAWCMIPHTLDVPEIMILGLGWLMAPRSMKDRKTKPIGVIRGSAWGFWCRGGSSETSDMSLPTKRTHYEQPSIALVNPEDMAPV